MGKQKRHSRFLEWHGRVPDPDPIRENSRLYLLGKAGSG